MTDKLVEKALLAKRESKRIDFKQGFDPDSKGDWCEVIKDIVSMANSGGGIIVFGLGNNGEPLGTDLAKIASLDPADIANKVGAYVGSSDLEITVLDLEKNGNDLVAFVMQEVVPPLVFERPGAYGDAGGKSKQAFALGSVYFRHGAKSEPGTNHDVQRCIQREIDSLRKKWLEGLRKVVEAPAGAEVYVGKPAMNTQSRTVRIGQEPGATVIRLTRDATAAAGILMHEQISDALFDEINNVIETNRLLFPGRDRFLLGEAIYYRIYAERRHVDQPKEVIAQLLNTGMLDYYPFLHWLTAMPEGEIAYRLSTAFLTPKGGDGNTLLRLLPLLGESCIQWTMGKFKQKWGKWTQPPNVYWRLEGLSRLKVGDPVTFASRLGAQNQLSFGETEKALAKELRDDSAKCSLFLSKACIEVFHNDKDYRSIARDLDYLAYGQQIVDRREAILELMKEAIGDRLPEDGAPDIDQNQ